MTGPATTQDQVITQARFYIDFTHIGRIAFSELSGITSKVVSTEYIYNDPRGGTVLTKQFGKTEPPTITLKRGLDAEGNAKLLLWHEMARNGDPMARSSGLLTVTDPSGKQEIVYQIINGWCSDLSITGLKAGDSSVTMIECKITCERIAAGK